MSRAAVWCTAADPAWQSRPRSAPMIMTRVPPPPDDPLALLLMAIGDCDCTVAAATTGWRLGLARCLLGTLGCLAAARSCCRWLDVPVCMELEVPAGRDMASTLEQRCVQEPTPTSRAGHAACNEQQMDSPGCAKLVAALRRGVVLMADP